MSNHVFALGGSRHLSRLPSGVLSALVASGASFRVGCCVGADALAVSALTALCPARLSVFAAFGALGNGACSLSALAALQAAAAAGVPVAWWAGGGVAVPLAARLARRSRAVVAGAAALVLFSPGPGSLSAAAHAAASAGLPVWAFGPRPAPIPDTAGPWLPATLVGFSCWRWSPAQFGF